MNENDHNEGRFYKPNENNVPQTINRNNNRIFSNNVRETPLPSIRRNRLARELESARKNEFSQENDRFNHSNLPPSTVIRNRFHDFLNGPAGITSSTSKRKRLFETSYQGQNTPENSEKRFNKKLFENAPTRNTLNSGTESFRRSRAESNVIPSRIYETPLINRAGDKPFDEELDSNGTVLRLSHNSQPRYEVNTPIRNNLSNFGHSDNTKNVDEEPLSTIFGTSSNGNRNSMNVGFDYLKTPIGTRTPESIKGIDSVARPGSAVRKLLDSALKESQRVTEVEMAKQESSRAQFELKKMELELKKIKIEMERTETGYKSKIEQQSKKIDNLEKERDWLFQKEKDNSKMLKEVETEAEKNKSIYDSTINKLNQQLEEESDLRNSQEQETKWNQNRLKNQILNLESKLTKAEKYRSLMEKQLISLIKGSNSGLPLESYQDCGWQDSISLIGEIIAQKNKTIIKIEKNSSSLESVYSTSNESSDDNPDAQNGNDYDSNFGGDTDEKSPVSETQKENPKQVTGEDHGDNKLSNRGRLNSNARKLKNKIVRLESQVAILERELSKFLSDKAKLKKENENLNRTIKYTTEKLEDIFVLKEKNNELEFKLSHLQKVHEEVATLEAEHKMLLQEREQYNSVFNSGKQADSTENVMPSPYNVARTVAKQRRELMEIGMKLDDIQTEKKSKATAVKEVEFLRSQLNSYDMEESNLMSKNYDSVKSERISNMETLVNTQRNYIDELEQIIDSNIKTNIGNSDENKEIKNINEQIKNSNIVKNLCENNENLQIKLENAMKNIKELEQQKGDLETNLNSLNEKYLEVEKLLAKAEHMIGGGDYNPLTTRILQLADNPSSREFAIRKSDLERLKAENNALLEQLEKIMETAPRKNVTLEADKQSDKNQLLGAASILGDVSIHPGRALEDGNSENHSSALFITISNLKSDNQKLIEKLNDSKKAIKRLKEVWRAKALELREAVYSLLGYRVDFLENGRVRLTSMYSSSANNSFIFGSSSDDKGTIELIGGGNKDYMQSLKADIRYWVSEKGSIPAFLATTTLQLFESNT
ncbi:hypothetical protein BB558_005781 [Smittium angustum]|uniref:Spindle assembly checkpoint component MAD1 n=1 Tax=Smittium angustum TaxID=133377 RepID=A0A2U1IZJ5_SMIAN|nr:hypothetical protein BB558_005781 [Smittium angustum]